MALVYMFLRSSHDSPVADVFREALPYGPYAVDGVPAFSPGWVIEIDPAREEAAYVWAVTDGLVRLVLNPVDSERLTLVLTPLPRVSWQLAISLGDAAETPIAFCYAGVEAETLLAHLGERIAAGPNPGELSFDQRVEAFMTGRSTVLVKAGDILGKAAIAADSSWRRLRFEVLPPGLFHLDEMVVPGGNRLDPMTFYTAVRAYTGLGAPLFDLADASNDLLLLGTPRTLLEVRTDQNLPYHGDIWIVTDGTTRQVTLAPGDRGHVELAPGLLHVVTSDLQRLRFTEVPTGAIAEDAVARVLASPAHWVVQAFDPRHWFADPNPPYPQQFEINTMTEGNRVTALIDGIETFESMFLEATRVEPPENRTEPHFVYLTTWCVQMDFPFVPGNVKSSLRELTHLWNERDVSFRALVWQMLQLAGPLAQLPNVAVMGCPNAGFVVHINGLPLATGPDGVFHRNARAISDHRTTEVEIPLVEYAAFFAAFPMLATQFLMVFGRRQPVGSHHQKILVINNRDGLVAFCGGIDPNSERLQEPGHDVPQDQFWSGTEGVKPYHDVHCKVEGPAAADLMTTFRHRWRNHPDCPAGDTLDDVPTIRTPPTKHFVQVARTYPRALHHPFAPDGDRTIFATLSRAIRRARKYVYLEDQYLTSVEMKDVLLEVVDRLAYLIIVVALEIGGMYPFRDPKRRDFIDPLKKKAGDRVRVFSLQARGQPTYVHAKVTLVDDVFASIGSANVNNRGFRGDSETNVMVVDGAVSQRAAAFARDFRIRLWGEHLGLSHCPELLVDPVEAGRLWTEPGPFAAVVPYDETAWAGAFEESHYDTPQGRWFYDTLVDPPGE